MAEAIIENQTNEEIESSNQESRSQHRIKQLSEKVELTAKERDEMKALREQDQKKIVELERENSFNSGFADMLGNPLTAAARDHKDEIKAKVLAGASVEDATFAVLGKAGKLGGASDSTPPQVAGGSSATTPNAGQKEVKDMTQAERRDILAKELIWQ